MNSLEGGVLMEYSSVITQLAATSEVANIGILFTVPAGERIRILSGSLGMSDQDSGIQGRIEYLNSLSAILALTFVNLDNQQLRIFPAVKDGDTAGVTEQLGFPNPFIMGGGQAIKMFVNLAIDAETILNMRLGYLARFGEIAVTVIGSGISISAESHKAI